MFRHFPTSAFLILVCGVLSGLSGSEEDTESQDYRSRTEASPKHLAGECGLRKEGADRPLRSVSSPTNEVPWLANIYHKDKHDDTKWIDKLCHGTLVTPHIVITVAHCVTSNDNFDPIKLKPADIRVVLGKHYRDFYRTESSSVMPEVREIVVPSEYLVNEYVHDMDIALLDLVDEVQVTNHIMPACIDWSLSLKPAAGEEITAEGWFSKESETVETAHLRLIEHEECIQHNHLSKNEDDKFCMENTNVDNPLRFGSGVGIVLEKNDHQFLIGILSLRLNDKPSTQVATNISSLKSSRWLETEKSRLELSHSKKFLLDAGHVKDSVIAFI